MTTIEIDSYLDWDVFATKPNWASEPRLSIDHEYGFFSDIGRAISRSSVDIAREMLTLKFLLENKEEIAGLRDFFDGNYGRMGAFWVPSWRSDIVVTTDFDATDADLFIEDMPYEEYYLGNLGAGRYIMLLFPDLTRKYNKVIGAPATNHLILDEQIGKAAAGQDLNYLMVSFLYLMRFNTDELRLEYHTNTVAESTIVFRTIFEEAVTTTTTTTSTTASTTSTTSTTSTSTTAAPSTTTSTT